MQIDSFVGSSTGFNQRKGMRWNTVLCTINIVTALPSNGALRSMHEPLILPS